MKSKTSNRRPLETMLVCDNTAPATGTFAGSVANQLNLNHNQIGILSWDSDSPVAKTGNFLTSSHTATGVSAIRVVRGTETSKNLRLADAWEVSAPAYQGSDVIYANQIRSVAVNKPTYGNVGVCSVTGLVVPADLNKEYGVNLKLDSARFAREYGANDNVEQASVILTKTYTNNLDFVLQTLISKFNNRSTLMGGPQPFVALGVKIAAGGSGTPIGTSTNATNFSVITQNGVTYTLPSSPALVTAFARLIAAGTITAASTIETVNLATAGAAAKIDAIIFVGLDHQPAKVQDEVAGVRVSVLANPTKGFEGAAVRAVTPVEEQNSARLLQLQYAQRAQVAMHTAQTEPHCGVFAPGYNPLKTTGFYTTYIIRHVDYDDEMNKVQPWEKSTIILFDATPTASATVSATVTALASGPAFPFTTLFNSGVESILSAWLESARTNYNNFAVLGDAVAAGAYLA